MSATQIPRRTSHREQLIKVVTAAETLVNATADPRVPAAPREHARRALHAAWGALQEFDAVSQ